MLKWEWCEKINLALPTRRFQTLPGGHLTSGNCPGRQQTTPHPGITRCRFDGGCRRAARERPGEERKGRETHFRNNGALRRTDRGIGCPRIGGSR